LNKDWNEVKYFPVFKCKNTIGISAIQESNVQFFFRLLRRNNKVLLYYGSRKKLPTYQSYTGIEMALQGGVDGVAQH
jgi:hypothetical protein